MLPDLVQQVQQTAIKVSKTGADGSYDTFDTYQYLIKAEIEPIIPPPMNAAWWVDQHDVLLDHPRNRALQEIDQGGLNASGRRAAQSNAKPILATIVVARQKMLSSAGTLSTALECMPLKATIKKPRLL
jgi:hypothetical protein